MCQGLCVCTKACWRVLDGLALLWLWRAAPCQLRNVAPGPLAVQGQVVFFNLDPNSNNEHLLWLFSKFGDVQASVAAGAPRAAAAGSF